MPTVFTHAAPVFALAAGLGGRVIPWRLAVAGVVCAVLPDLDVLGLRFGIPYREVLGHRGASHSLLFALVLACLGAWLAPWLRCGRLKAFAVMGLAALSHIALDALTDGGLGVAAFWPWDDARYFFATRPIEVSPISVRRFLSGRGLAVLASEFVWVWLPCAAFALAGMAARFVLRRVRRLRRD